MFITNELEQRECALKQRMADAQARGDWDEFDLALRDFRDLVYSTMTLLPPFARSTGRVA